MKLETYRKAAKLRTDIKQISALLSEKHIAFKSEELGLKTNYMTTLLDPVQESTTERLDNIIKPFLEQLQAEFNKLQDE